MSDHAATGRVQSTGEEFANAVIHGAGLIGSVVALPVLVVTAAGRRDPWEITGAAIFGATLVLLFLSSTLYHALPPSRAKRVLRVLDHSAIYLLIAGTYTPFMLGPLRGSWGWALLGTNWGLAMLGIVAKSTLGFRFRHVSTALYLVMGWLVIIAIQPLVTHVSRAGLAWLIAGGLLYTAGVVFYVTDRRVRYGHAVWHVFVLAGTICHFFAVLGHARSPAG